MGFLVEDDGRAKSGKKAERVDINLLVIGKRTGLTFAEINELRVSDLLLYIEKYTGNDKNKPRKATQEDIDKFLA